MSRLDKLKEQHPELNVSIIDILSSLDPTDTYKYTEFLIKNFKKDNTYYNPNSDEFKVGLGILLFGPGRVETLNEFERHAKANRIKEKDISKYHNFIDLDYQVKMAEEVEKRKKLEKEILKLHEDDTWLILTPLSFEASKVYGSNTKWCVTQEKYWNSYLSTHRLIYCINKKTKTKIAFSREFSTDKFQAWDQQDKEVSPMFINFIPDDIFLMIINELQKELRTINLIRGEEPSKRIFKISDFAGDTVDTTDMEGVVDRLRRLMGIVSDNNNRNIITLPDSVPSITELTSPINHNDDYNFRPRRVTVPNDWRITSESAVSNLRNYMNNVPASIPDLPTEEPSEETVVRRRITDYPRNMTMNVDDYLTYFDHPTPSLVTEHNVRPITSFTGGTINY
jgi:hypothetical protein